MSVRLTPSIAPVGLEHTDTDGLDDEVTTVQQTASISIELPAPKPRLSGVVIGVIAGCALVLAAAVVARVSRASGSEPTASAQSSRLGAAAPQPAPPPLDPPANVEPAPAPVVQAVSTTGTLRLHKPAAPGRVWLDGKKLTADSAILSCGAHLLRVGRGRARSVQVPCGGELVVSR